MELLATFLLGLVAGLVLAWVNGALGEHGRQWAVARIERRRAAQQEREAEEAAVAARDAAQEQTERKVETLERLRREREGRCFVWRADADDVGMRGIVEELDARQPARRVIVR